MKKVFVVFNCYQEIIELIKNLKDDIFIINNCSTDKRYYENLNKFNIIHMDNKYSKEYLINFIKTNNIIFDKIYFFEDDDIELFSLNSKFVFNNIKYNFDNIIKKVYKNKYNFENNLDNLHLLIDSKFINDNDLEYFNNLTLIGINDRKSVFIRDFYNYIDSNNEFINLYKNFIKEYIKPFYPNEESILYQKTPNIRIGFPNLTAIGKKDSDPDSKVIGLHNDNEFGHSIQEINYIIPITKMFDTNSIYFEKTVNSNENPENYNNLYLDTNEYFQGYFNKLYHFNKINKTGKTRISLDFRIIPYSKYIENENDKSSVTSNKKLVLDEYFELI